MLRRGIATELLVRTAWRLLSSAGRQAFRERSLETCTIVPEDVEIAHFDWLGLCLDTTEHLNELPPRTEHVSYLLGSLRVS